MPGKRAAFGSRAVSTSQSGGTSTIRHSSIIRVPATGRLRVGISLRWVIACVHALIVVVTSGCDSSIGPVHLQIQTGGVRYEDFVIEPTQEYGRIHGSKMVTMDAQVVASEQALVLSGFTAGWTFTALLVSVYHPEFIYAWTSQAKSPNGEIELPPLHPRKWSDYIDEHGEVSLRMVEAHLDRILLGYIPVFEPGESRRRLRRYLPGLRGLVEQASWKSKPSSHWVSEAEARADLHETLQAISESM